MKKRQFSRKSKRLSWPLLIAIGLFHIVALYLLAHALAPKFTQSVEQSVADAFTVTVTTSDPPPPPPADPAPDEGAQGEPGKEAVPKPEAEPPSPVETPRPRPRASSTGTANRSGAQESGEGTGAAGSGDGTGSGQSGSGQGNGVSQARKQSVRSGEINTATDFPVPEGGRSTRFGKRVRVKFTITTDGRAKNCSVTYSDVDAETTGLVCGLVMQKIRFNPKLDRNGNPVEVVWGYEVRFNQR